jgi:hypothetical protein
MAPHFTTSVQLSVVLEKAMFVYNARRGCMKRVMRHRVLKAQGGAGGDNERGG